MNGPLTSYAKLRVAHAPGITGTFSPPLWISYPNKHHGTCETHLPGPLTSGFLWSRWRRKRSRHSRRMRKPPFCVSGKRPMREMCLPWRIHHFANPATKIKTSNFARCHCLFVSMLEHKPSTNINRDTDWHTNTLGERPRAIIVLPWVISGVASLKNHSRWRHR